MARRESLHRIYAVVEDAIFKAAKKDETMKMARVFAQYAQDVRENLQDVAEASESVQKRGELENNGLAEELNMDSIGE